MSQDHSATLTPLGLRYWIGAVSDLAEAFEREKGRLCQLDGAIGDGDHGASMALGFSTARARLAEQPPTDAAGLLGAVGGAFVSRVGGVTGIIFGSLFLGAGKAVEGNECVTAADLAAMFASALEMVKARGKASEGDKTMVDALAPAVVSLVDAAARGTPAAESLRLAAQSAERGMLATSDMVARQGRARYQGDKARGHVDPGAASVALIFQTLAKAAQPSATGRGICADGAPSGPLAECLVRDGIPNVLAKLKQGRAVRTAYLGGSITNANDGWRPQSLEWFQKQYPNTRIEGINAAISGTGSDLAAFRLKQDVLAHEPDLMFVEFAVNDSWTSDGRIQRAMEGVVRQTWRAYPDCDFVYTVHEGMLEDLQAGELPHAVKSHEIVADHYGIPSVLLGLEVARMEKEGRLVFTGRWPQTEAEKAALEGKILFSADGAHPYAQGHALYVHALTRSVAKMDGEGKCRRPTLPQPLFADNYEHVVPTPVSKAHLSHGWRRLDPATDLIARELSKQLPEVWLAETPGETITVGLRGTSLMVFDAVGPDCGQIIVTVDDGEPRVVPRFDSWCEWHRVYCFTAAADLPDGPHTVKMEIDSKRPDKAAVLAERSVTMDDPKRYDGTRWYVGSLLITGHLIE